MKRCLFLLLFFIVSFCVNKLTAQNLPQPVKNSVKKVVASLSTYSIRYDSAGNFEVKAASSADVYLTATFNSATDKVVEKLTKALVFAMKQNELKEQNTESRTGFIEDLNGFAVLSR